MGPDQGRESVLGDDGDGDTDDTRGAQPPRMPGPDRHDDRKQDQQARFRGDASHHPQHGRQAVRDEPRDRADRGEGQRIPVRVDAVLAERQVPREEDRRRHDEVRDVGPPPTVDKPLDADRDGHHDADTGRRQ